MCCCAGSRALNEAAATKYSCQFLARFVRPAPNPGAEFDCIRTMGQETLINLDVDRSPQTIGRALGDLRALAAWYREYAELAGNPSIWASRVMTAEDLEREASDLEQRLV